MDHGAPRKPRALFVFIYMVLIVGAMIGTLTTEWHNGHKHRMTHSRALLRLWSSADNADHDDSRYGSANELRRLARLIYTPHVVDQDNTVTVAFVGHPKEHGLGRVIEDTRLILYMIEQATRRRVVYPPSNIPFKQQWDQAEVLIFSGFIKEGRPGLQKLAAAYRGSKLLIWNLVENVDRNDWWRQYSDQLVDLVDVSFGVRRNNIDHPHYLRYPGWLGNALRPWEHGCEWPSEWDTPDGAAEEWASRKGFASIVATHGAEPRKEIVHTLKHMGYGDVHGLSNFYHNVDGFPPMANETHFEWKKRFLRQYKFNICPENTRSIDGGYVTEKIIHAFEANAIPIYWGDTPIESGFVFNNKRIIHWTTPNELAHKVKALMADEDGAVERWFQEPLLKPTAYTWVAQWCADARSLLEDKWSALNITCK